MEGGHFVEFIRDHTPEDALIITLHDEFLWSPEARTGRKFLYKAGECPTMNKSTPEPCENRKSLITKLKHEIEKSEVVHTEMRNCGFGDFLKLNKNTFLAIDRSKTRYQNDCEELQEAAVDINFQLLKIN